MNARGFAAFPPGPQRSARTWWGKAWVKAMEDTSLDAGQLRRGRRYANRGMVGSITVSPGRISADVHDEAEAATYRTVVFVGQLTVADWDRIAEQIAAKAGHIAALMDREMPRELVETAADAEVPLLPEIGDLEPECECPSWELPCKHAAALCYQVSWLVDEDPFLLLLMRGRDSADLLDDLRARTTPTEPDGGTPAAQAYAKDISPLPRIDVVLPGSAIADVPDGPGVEADALRLLVADAAARAKMLLAGVETPCDEWSDSVRLAATHQLSDRLRDRSSRPADFDRSVRAWQQAGATGLAVLDEPWEAPVSVLAKATAAIAAAWDGEDLGQSTVDGNRWTWPERGWQLRYGRDSRWHPYRLESGQWWPAGAAAADPVTALGELS
ncbi:SWIM zinc finger family protein [Fodinicola acaciae]|uniref:SWIM zinc finger family protein n=1 Tax=Fodinicola acaciae TaxID=2681555 RepID=UPI0013D45B05|nr:SWIM zinc finger family protein [Fodinicola acaciae]